MHDDDVTNEENKDAENFGKRIIEYTPSSLKAYFRIKAKSSVYHFSQYLIRKYHIKTIKGTKRELFIYQDGVYISGEEIVKKEIREILEEHAKTHVIKEVTEAVKDLTPVDRDDFIVPINFINLNNGVYDIDTGVFSEHSHENLFLTKLPVNFKESADCPLIKKFLSDVLDDEQIPVIQEWFGFGLKRDYSIKKALILVGGPDTGKTTLITLEEKFIGKKNISGVSLQKISADKFALANMYTKYLNTYDDLSFRDVNDNGAFKIATGGGLVTGERKFGDQFQFRNHAKLMFACNKIPEVKDSDDDAYFKRWIVIRFNYPIEEKDRDNNLVQKMTTDEEMSGLLNFALEGLRRLVKNGSFSYEKTVDEIKDEMQTSSSPVARFAVDCLEQKDDSHIFKDEMHNAYKHFAKLKKLPYMSLETLGKRLPKYAHYIESIKPVNSRLNKQASAWSGVQFKPSFNLSLPRESEAEIQQDDLDSIDSNDF